MKKLFVAILILSFIVTAFSGCSSGSDYKRALKLIEDEKYEEAYELLNEAVRGTEDLNECRALLNRFRVIYKRTEATAYKVSHADKYNPQTVEIYTTVELDDMGNVILEEVRDKDSVLSKYTYSYEYDNNDNVTTKLAYDLNGNLLLETDYITDEYNGKTEYQYDENGNLTSTTKCGNNKNAGQSEFEYKYDESGNLISISELPYNYNGYDTIGTKTVMEYDENGFVCKKLIYSDSRLEEEITFSDPMVLYTHFPD